MNDCVEHIHLGIHVHKTSLQPHYACQEATTLVEETVSYWTAGRNDIEVLANNSYTYNVNSFVAVKKDCV